MFTRARTSRLVPLNLRRSLHNSCSVPSRLWGLAWLGLVIAQGLSPALASTDECSAIEVQGVSAVAVGCGAGRRIASPTESQTSSQGLCGVGVAKSLIDRPGGVGVACAQAEAVQVRVKCCLRGSDSIVGTERAEQAASYGSVAVFCEAGETASVIASLCDDAEAKSQPRVGSVGQKGVATSCRSPMAVARLLVSCVPGTVSP